ncbi:phosphotransferase [Tateyamaria sp. syn59]|uniref:phosphotransferase n=1 Tax=Tateyamaria sp. syn59 TaxID=2576942 RepID=UPI001679855D|nr:phosphotransferase [Tateyamaria sp. syn59]
MVFDRKDRRVTQALARWAEVAPTLGFQPGAFRHKLIWQKDEKTRSHIVLRLKGPRALIIKQVTQGAADKSLSDTVNALRDAHQRLLSHTKAHAPEVLFSTETGDFIVMTEATGRTFEEHVNKGRTHGAMLKRVGAWLSAFHGSGPLERRTYQPSFMVGHIERMQKLVEDDPTLVAEPDHFIACCKAVPKLAEAAEGRQTYSASKHGDFNVRNILLGPDGETGLDFKPPGSAPVGFDIVRFLMDYAELFQPLPKGQLLTQDTLDAFFNGYTLVDPDDPAVRFLPYVQLLNDWKAIPSDPQERSWRQRARMANISALATTAFGAE